MVVGSRSKPRSLLIKEINVLPSRSGGLAVHMQSVSNGSNTDDNTLRNIDDQLVGLGFTNKDFSKANIKNKDLSFKSFTNIDFTRSDLTNVNFTGADLTNVNFTGANLTNVNFTGATFSGVNFTGANLTNTKIIQLFRLSQNIDFTNADLSNADLSGLVVFSGVSTGGILIYKPEPPPPPQPTFYFTRNPITVDRDGLDEYDFTNYGYINISNILSNSNYLVKSVYEIDNVSISGGDGMFSNPVTLTYENNQWIIKLTGPNSGTCTLTVTQKTTNTIAETTLVWGAMRQD